MMRSGLFRRAMLWAPPVGAVVLLAITHGHPHTAAPRHPALAATGPGAVVLTAGEEPVVEYVADRPPTRSRVRHVLPSPNAGVASPRVAAVPVTQPVEAPELPSMSVPTVVVPPSPAVIPGDLRRPRARQELSQQHAPPTTEDLAERAALRDRVRHIASRPAGEGAPVGLSAAPGDPVVQPSDSAPAQSNPALRAPAAPIASAPAVPTPTPSAPVVQPSENAPTQANPALNPPTPPIASAPAVPTPTPSGPIAQPVDVTPSDSNPESIQAPRSPEAPVAPVLSAPLAATPAAAGPVVAPVDGMPELPPATEAVGGDPVGGAPDETSADLPAEAPAPTGEQLPTDQVPAPAVATPQVDQRWAHMEPVGQQPTAYPGANSTGPVPGLSAAVGSVPSPPAFQAPKGFGQMLAPSKVRTPEMMMRPRDLEMVARRADGHTMAGFELAGRRAYMSAQAEFLQALRMIAESLDIHHGTDRHSKALVAGMRALEESDEFMPTGRGLEGELDVRVLSQGHRSPVLTAEEAHGMAPLEARQRYYAYAQEQLAAAGAGETSASMALHGLGKLLTALAQAPDSPVLAPEPKAMVLQQAALLVDGRNALAANELGVLLARAGRYEQAREVLLHSARLLPQPTTWHNLAVVHFQLGEQDLGQLAQLESKAAEEHARQLAARRGVSINPHVQWLGPEEFAKTTATDMGAPGQPAVAPTSTAQQPAKSQGGKTR